MNQKDDQIIKQEIIEQLTWDDSVNSTEITVMVHEGVVTLEGTIPSYSAKRNAEKDALKVRGVSQIENKLDVSFPTGVTLPDDATITSNIEKMLILDNRLNADQIEVQTHEGLVTLSGTAASQWEKNLAEEIASSSAGVVFVQSNLKTSQRASYEDKVVENNIKRAFERNPLISDDAIAVTVHEGVATLRGIVPYYLMKREIYDVALYTPGVADVVDEVTVSSRQPY